LDKLTELKPQFDALRLEIQTLSDQPELSAEEETRFAAALDEFGPLRSRFEAAETRSRAVDEVRRAGTHYAAGADINQINRREGVKPSEVGDLGRAELRDAALALAEKGMKHLPATVQARFEKNLKRHDGNFNGDVLARMTLISESEEYHSAFMKTFKSPQPRFSAAEAEALDAFDELRGAQDYRQAREQRAFNEGTSSSGGYGVPIFIDPTIILSSGAAQAPILDIARIVQSTTNVWKGVTSAAAVWSYDAESAAVADRSTTLTQPSINVYKADSFLPYTIEIGQDYPGFEEELAMVLSQGYLDLMASQSMTGSGSSQPYGIFTRLQNTTTNPVHYVVKTLGALGAVDARGAWAQLPERFRPNATWVMNVAVENQIRSWASGGLALSDFTINMLPGGVSELIGRPIVKSDYAPSPTNTTAAESFLVVGDFSHFVIVQRAGMEVEPVGLLFDQATARPNGTRGLYAYARNGMDTDSVNRAFTLVSNT
jgi:HK97 family phage major capsid protein